MTAEEVLKRLQETLLERAEARPLLAPHHTSGREAEAVTSFSRSALRSLEETWGASATQMGRWLTDLLHGSAAWDIVQQPQPRHLKRLLLPRPPEISRCEPVLRIMRESGELAERERLLQERDSALNTLWKYNALREEERQEASQKIYDRYLAEVMALSAVYRPLYQEMRRALGTVPPLTGLQVRSRPLLLPPLMTLLFNACHGDKDHLFAPVSDGGTGGGFETERRGRTYAVRLRVSSPDALVMLDEMTWDIAAIAVSAFFVRTSASDPDSRYPALMDDYFDWRGVDLRKRLRDTRQQIDARLRLLCSDRLRFHMETELWVLDAGTGRRSKTTFVSEGTFLRHFSGLYRPSPWLSETENEPLFGHLVSLGEWARPLIQARAMIGLFPKPLAEYDLGREQWERRIGWYLTFQMQNQGAKMTFREPDAAEVRAVEPQHALKMKTVLQNSQVQWEEMARTNPGKVIKQWVNTLENLRRDGILGGYSCLDGAADGFDLPVRHRLSAMLEYRYLVVPGGECAQRLQKKAARRAGGLK